MSDTLHLVKLPNGAWVYRRRVPVPLIGRFGKPIVKFGLGVTSKKIAIQKRAIEDVKYDAIFYALAQDAEAIYDPEQGVLSKSAPAKGAVLELVRDYVKRLDAGYESGWLAEPLLEKCEVAEAKSEVALELAIASDHAPQYDHEQYIAHYLESIFGASTQPDPVAPSNNALFGLVKRARVEVLRREQARLNDHHERVFFDKLFDPALSASVTVGELADQYIKLEKEDAKYLGTNAKTLDKKGTNVELVRELLGSAMLVRDINWDACRKFVSDLSRVPQNRNKIYPSLPVQEQIKRAKLENKPGMAQITQEQYLGALKELLELGVKKDLLRTNYATGLKVLKVDSTSAEEKRVPFELSQLANFFGSAFYLGCAKSPGPAYRGADVPWRFWFPLIALFNGMRPREIFQLRLTDVRQTAKGAWYLDVEATDDDDETAAVKKSLKTATSRRQVPLHPELIRVGFLEFIEDLKKQSKDQQIFRDISLNKYGDPAHYPLRRFREKYLKEGMVVKPRQTPYSFRHTWRDAARLIDATPEFLRAVAGWSDGKSTADVYGSNKQPDLHAPMMAKIAYEGLDLSYLYINAEPNSKG